MRRWLLSRLAAHHPAPSGPCIGFGGRSGAIRDWTATAAERGPGPAVGDVVAFPDPLYLGHGAPPWNVSPHYTLGHLETDGTRGNDAVLRL